MEITLPKGKKITLESLYTSEHRMREILLNSIKKHSTGKKPFKLRITGKFLYLNEHMDLVPDMNTQAMNLLKTWKELSPQDRLYWEKQAKFVVEAKSAFDVFKLKLDKEAKKVSRKKGNEKDIVAEAWEKLDNQSKKKFQQDYKKTSELVKKFIPDIYCSKSSQKKPDNYFKGNGRVYSYIAPSPARAPVIFYIVDTENLPIYSLFYGYQPFYVKAKEDFENLPKEEQQVYTNAYELDKFRLEIESAKGCCVAYAKALEKKISWHSIYKRPLASSVGTVLSNINKVSVLTSVFPDDLFNDLVKKLNETSEVQSFKHSIKVLNSFIKSLPRDKPKFQYIFNTISLNSTTINLYIIKQGILHCEEWEPCNSEDTGYVNFECKFLKYPSRTEMCTCTEVSLYEIEDLEFLSTNPTNKKKPRKYSVDSLEDPLDHVISWTPT